MLTQIKTEDQILSTPTVQGEPVDPTIADISVKYHRIQEFLDQLSNELNIQTRLQELTLNGEPAPKVDILLNDYQMSFMESNPYFKLDTLFTRIERIHNTLNDSVYSQLLTHFFELVQDPAVSNTIEMNVFGDTIYQTTVSTHPTNPQVFDVAIKIQESKLGKINLQVAYKYLKNKPVDEQPTFIRHNNALLNRSYYTRSQKKSEIKPIKQQFNNSYDSLKEAVQIVDQILKNPTSNLRELL